MALSKNIQLSQKFFKLYSIKSINYECRHSKKTAPPYLMTEYLFIKKLIKINFYRFFAKLSIFFCFSVFFALSLLGILDGSSTEHIRFFESLFFSLAFWIIITAVIGNVYWILIFCIPIAFLVPLEFWQRIFIGKPTSMHFMAFFMETTWGEAFNFLLIHGKNIIYIYIPWLVIYSISLLESRRLSLKWRNSFLYASAAIFMAIIIVYYFMQGASAWMTTDEAENAFDGRLADGWSRQWEDVFPINIIIASQRYFLEQDKLVEIQKSLHIKKLNASLKNNNSAPEIVILVIGESSTISRWSLFGYKNLTNPKLQSINNIIGYDNVVSVSLATRSAVPSAIAQQPILLPTGHINKYAEPSLVQAYKEAGYKTYWLSNQSPFGKFDSSIAIHAREAEFVHFLNPSTYETRGSLDEILLKPLQNLIDNPGRKLVILHTLGSHFDYSLRYSDNFNVFNKNTNNISSDHVKISNTYDNSILYTDNFLSEVINLISTRKNSAVVAYFSDHGEDLPGGVCDYNGVNRRTASAYKIPVLFWLSNEYINNHYDFYNLLRIHRREPYTTRAISSTILDIGHVDISNKKQDQENFFIKPNLSTSPRMVAFSETMINFDLANAKNPCYISSK